MNRPLTGVLAAAAACLTSACGAPGVVGTYACPRAGAISELELAGDGKATWTFMPGGQKGEFRYEAKEDDIRIYRTVSATSEPVAANADPLSHYQQSQQNRQMWHFQFHDGNLLNLVNESESCTRR